MNKYFRYIWDIFLVILLIAGFYLIFRTDLFISDIIEPEFTKEEIIEAKEQEQEIQDKEKTILDIYRSLPKVRIYEDGFVTPASLIEACKEGDKNQKLCNREIAKITKVIKTNPEITKAYLYVRAAVSRGDAPLSLLTRNDSIYFFIDNAKQYGGHLLRSEADWSRVSNDDIELIFNMESVPFTHLPYSENADTDKTPDLLEVLNEPGEHYIGSFVSTLGYGRLWELNIAYEGGYIEIEE